MASITTWNIQVKLSTVLLVTILSGSSSIGYCAPNGNSDDGAFSIQHVNSSKCLVGSAERPLLLANCTTSTAPPDPSMLWKWGHGHRLFHLGTSLCMGVDLHHKALGLFECDSGDAMLGWHCVGQTMYTDYEMGIGVDTRPRAKRKPTDGWRRAGTDNSICQQEYDTIHTTQGNAMGAPCVFPFLYNGTWHHSCLPGQPDLKGLTQGLSWCSSTISYTQHGKWGFCLLQVEGCHTLWEERSSGQCYQSVSTATVSWHQARDSCRSQGGDLLSITSAQELKDLESMNIPDKLWMGLNQMDWAEGWQWSDGSALSVVSWRSDMPVLIGLGELDCGVLTNRTQYENAMCERKLPYVCKKPNSKDPKPTDRVVYASTLCEDDWFPWNGRCMKHFEEAKSQDDARSNCKASNASLLSIHSLEDMYMFNTMLPGTSVDMWTGLTGTGIPLVFQWDDGSKVTYTHWAKDNPRIEPSTRLPTCVRFTGPDHQWVVSQCDVHMSYVCARPGVVNESLHDEGCPEGWRRHGNNCYKVDPTPVSIKNSCNLTITDRFEQVFINRLLRELVGNKTQYFWTGLQDIKGNGEYTWTNGDNVTFTNWGWRQPVMSGGGCVVMSTSRLLGKWQTRNCSLFEAGTICKKNLTAISTVPTHIDTTTPCPDGWYSKPGIAHCYKVFHEERLSRKRSWSEAEGFCRSLGAHLPSFTHVDEMGALHELIRQTTSDDRFFWVGLNRRNPNSEDTWEWSDGRPMSTAVLHEEYNEEDKYNRDCAAFKSLRGSINLLFYFLLHDLPARPYYTMPFHCDAALEWACQIPRGKTPLTPRWYNPGGHHETSVFVDGQEFWFVQLPRLSYPEAEAYCTSNASRLAAPRSAIAARTIQEKITKLTGKYLNYWADLKEPGPYMPMPFTQMHYYHSAFLGRCPSLSPESFIPDYKQFCSAELPFVCEVLNVTSAEREPIGPHPNGSRCDGASIAFRDKCYTVIPPQEVTFRKASELCSVHRGGLLTITDQVEQDFVISLLPSLPPRTWVGLKLKYQEMVWVDNTPVTYLNFHPLVHGQYRRLHVNTFSPEGLELCSYMFNDPNSHIMGTWDYTSCTDFQNISICQHYADKPEIAVVSEKPFTVQGHTYQLVLKNMSWFEAQDHCRNQKMELASVADAFQQAVLTVNVSRLGQPVWIGLYSEDDEGEQYIWSDHSHTVFSRWAKESSAGRCVYLDTDGFWKATECERGLGAAICHTPHEDKSPEPSAKKCPHTSGGPNWFPYEKNCYTFQLLHSRWEHHEKGDIQKICQQFEENASLVTVRNAEENEFLRQHLLPLKDLAHFIWLGMYQDNTTKQLKWYDESYVQFSNWKNGRPEVDGEFLAGLGLDGRWDLYANKAYFQPFKQNSVVACKIESLLTRKEFMVSPWEARPYGNFSYQVVGRKLNWFQAQEECARGGGHLVSVSDAAQSSHLLDMARRDGFPLWIGLSNQEGNGSVYEWSDGSKFDFSPLGFHKGSVVGNCVFLDTSGMWVSTRCLDLMEGALCYNSTTERTSPQKAQESSRCPKTDGTSRWEEHGDHCYAFDMTFYNYTVYTLDAAKKVCQELHSSAYLLSIKSDTENNFVTDYITKNFHITSRVWLGLETKTDDFMWMDDSKVDYTKWKSVPTVVRIYPSPEVCAVMLTKEGGLWRQTNCRDSHGRVVCKAPMKSRGLSSGAIFCLIAMPALLGVALYFVYKKTRHHFSSPVRYQRQLEEMDSTSIIHDTE